MNSYKTIRQPAREEYVINKSRFIGHACPCQTEEQALAFLKRIREEYRDATHNCYAYVIGENAGIMRYSDDGEPGGTAGLPMMEVLKARSVVNLCVVVTRYFGGILLGAGGLVRAYSHSCALALDAAHVSIMELTQRVVSEKKLTTLMVTHNLKFAVQYGNRLLMMHQGHAVIDIQDEEKAACTVDDLLSTFNSISIECGN